MKLSKEEILERLKNWASIHKQVAEENYRMDGDARYSLDLMMELEKLLIELENTQINNFDTFI